MAMLNEDKIKLMTGIAMFEKKEGKKISPANHRFRSDYISGHMLLGFFSYTVCYALCASAWILYNSETLLNVVDLEEIGDILKTGVVLYATGLFLYLLITWLIYRKRYEYARRGVNVYLAKLKRLEKRYEYQSRSKELTKEDIRNDDTSRT